MIHRHHALSRFLSSTTFGLAALALLASGPRLGAQTRAVVKILHNFTGTGTDGASPGGRLVEGRDGDFYGTTEEGGGPDGFGEIYKISAAGAYAQVHPFGADDTDGEYPTGGLTLGGDGNFYGSTIQGGSSSNEGIVFRITPGGAVTILHTCENATTDGDMPEAGAIRDSAGNVYGVTFFGGINNDGIVYEIPAAGGFTILHNFNFSDNDGDNPVTSLIQSREGTIYGTTDLHGTTPTTPIVNGSIFQITPKTGFSILYRLSGIRMDGTNASSLIQGRDGDFYGTTPNGGSGGMGLVFRITADGKFFPLHPFTGGTTEGAFPYAALVEGRDGNFYGVTNDGGSNDGGTIFRVTPAGVLATLYNFPAPNKDGVGVLANDLVQGSDGCLYGTTDFGGSSDMGAVYQLDLKPAITSAVSVSTTVGKAFSYQIKATNTPTKFGVLGLPAGVHVDTATGLVSGTPTAAGVHPLTLQAANVFGTGETALTLTVRPLAPVVTSADTAAAQVGKAFSYRIAATNSPTRFGVLGLFSGITVNKTTGLISGTPTAAGTHTLTLQATNGGGTGQKTLTLTVAAK